MATAFDDICKSYAINSSDKVKAKAVLAQLDCADNHELICLTVARIAMQSTLLDSLNEAEGSLNKKSRAVVDDIKLSLDNAKSSNADAIKTLNQIHDIINSLSQSANKVIAQSQVQIDQQKTRAINEANKEINEEFSKAVKSISSQMISTSQKSISSVNDTFHAATENMLDVLRTQVSKIRLATYIKLSCVLFATLALSVYLTFNITRTYYEQQIVADMSIIKNMRLADLDVIATLSRYNSFSFAYTTFCNNPTNQLHGSHGETGCSIPFWTSAPVIQK